MHKQPLISFCIPTYNRAPFLLETLKSILAQPGPDIEIVISDNASTDGTEALVADFKKKYSAIQYARNESNLGYDRNLLRAIALARGEYIWLFGSDDLLKPGGVHAVRQALQDRPAMVFLNHEVFAEPDQILFKSMLGRGKDINFRSANAYIAFIGWNFSFMTALVLKKDLCLQIEDAEAVLGTGWIHLHTVLWIVAHEHSFRFVGYPYVRARAPRVPAYDALRAFAGANKTIWNAHKYGHPYWILYLLIGRTLVQTMMRAVGGTRVRESCSVRELVPLLVRAYWMFPHFWVLVFPLVLLPRGLLVVIRQAYRYLRAAVQGLEPPT